MPEYKAIVIGISAGGFRAMKQLLQKLPESFSLPIMVVQHRKKDSDSYYVESLSEITKIVVKEADEKEKIRAGTIYIAPAGYHLLIEKDTTFSLSVDEPVSFARPSIDVLFETAAEAYKTSLIGIVLTGANCDGSRGIEAVKKYGGFTIAQNPHTAEISFMPQSAIDTDCVDKILDLEEIIPFLVDLLEK